MNGTSRWLAVAGLAGAGIVGRWALRPRPLDLHGQVVLITGGSRGLGLALAEAFAVEGARVAICARDADELRRAGDHLHERAGTSVLALTCDVTDRGQVVEMVQRVTEHYGRVDVLVNNAGVILAAPQAEQTIADFEQCLATMFWGPLYATYAVLPQMRARGAGHIVNITSVGGKVAVPHLLSYASAKFAAVGFSEGLHAELRPDGIHVLTVVPGLMRTGSHLNALFKGRHRTEYTLFALLATNPLSAVDARGAARSIVASLRHGDAELIISWQAQLLSRLHGLFPGQTTRLLTLVNALLPPPGGIGTRAARGAESQTSLTESPLTVLGRRAAAQLNQTGG